MCSEYKDVFDGLGNLGTPLRLEVDEEVKPVQQPTEWANSVVIAGKANGKHRFFLDPKPLSKAVPFPYASD